MTPGRNFAIVERDGKAWTKGRSKNYKFSKLLFISKVATSVITEITLLESGHWNLAYTFISSAVILWSCGLPSKNKSVFDLLRKRSEHPPTRGYKVNIPKYEIISHLALSGIAYAAGTALKQSLWNCRTVYSTTEMGLSKDVTCLSVLFSKIFQFPSFIWSFSSRCQLSTTIIAIPFHLLVLDSSLATLRISVSIPSRRYRPLLKFCPCPRLIRHFGGVSQAICALSSAYR
jgi:hypothetical protein